MDSASPLWRVDAAGNVRPWRPSSAARQAGPAPPVSPPPAPLPSPAAPVLAALWRPGRLLALPPAADVARRQYPEPVDAYASLAFFSPAGSSYKRYRLEADDATVSIGEQAAARNPPHRTTVKKQAKGKQALAPRRAAAASSAVSSTERGRRFRKRLQEREVQARADIELLRQQILRIQALKRSGQQQALLSHHRDLLQAIAGSTAAALGSAASQIGAEARLGGTVLGESALRFVREYFVLFRFGVLSPAANPNGTTAGVALDSSRHEAFLAQCAAPDVKFDEFVGVGPMVDQWRRYSSVHSFIKLDPVNMEVQGVDGRATVVAKGVLHIRYSRRTLESVFPRLLSDQPALAERLVGRLVHMHYTSHYFFDEAGKLVNQQIVPDYVSALKDVLGSLDDVAKVLDCALLREHVLGEIDYDRYEEKVAATVEDAGEGPSRGSPPTGGGMNIDFLLS